MQSGPLRVLTLLVKIYCLLSGVLVFFAGLGLLGYLLMLQTQRVRPVHFMGSSGTVQAQSIPPPKRPLSSADMAFGEKQVETMVRDRPEMGKYVHPGDPIWEFCAHQYGGEAIGQRILWNSAPPVGGATAEHELPYMGSVGKIRVSLIDPERKTSNTCEELWSYACFELCNIRQFKSQDDAWDAALTGKINRQEYIKRASQLEYRAYPYTLWIYNTLWKPAMDTKGIQTRPELWGSTIPGTVDAWFAQYEFEESKTYPAVPYGTGYDEATMPILRQNAKANGWH